jgi:very-short-patch-repair endonuclease
MSDSSSRIRGTTPPVETAAKELRQRLTPAEQKLWQALRGGKLAGLKFRRQHPVGNFILDFYCSACKLAIELDGSIHETQLEYDAARTAQLEAYGYKVLRFSNAAVMQQLETVLVNILQTVSELSAEVANEDSDRSS